MLNDFLNRVASVTGRTYTPEEFGLICVEAIMLARKKDEASNGNDDVKEPKKSKKKK